MASKLKSFSFSEFSMIKVLIFMLIFTFAITYVSASYQVTECQEINNSGVYILQNDLTTSNNIDYCLRVYSDDVIIDGNGYWINNTNFFKGIDYQNQSSNNFTIENLGFNDNHQISISCLEGNIDNIPTCNIKLINLKYDKMTSGIGAYGEIMVLNANNINIIGNPDSDSFVNSYVLKDSNFSNINITMLYGDDGRGFALLYNKIASNNTFYNTTFIDENNNGYIFYPKFYVNTLPDSYGVYINSLSFQFSNSGINITSQKVQDADIFVNNEGVFNNEHGRVTLYNVVSDVVFKNGEVCSECTNKVLTGNSISFDIEGEGNYTVGYGLVNPPEPQVKQTAIYKIFEGTGAGLSVFIKNLTFPIAIFILLIGMIGIISSIIYKIYHDIFGQLK